MTVGGGGNVTGGVLTPPDIWDEYLARSCHPQREIWGKKKHFLGVRKKRDKIYKKQ